MKILIRAQGMLAIVFGIYYTITVERGKSLGSVPITWRCVLDNSHGLAKTIRLAEGLC